MKYIFSEDLWRSALNAGSASNFLGLANSLPKIVESARQELLANGKDSTSAALAQHPCVRAVLHHLAGLSGEEPDASDGFGWPAVVWVSERLRDAVLGCHPYCGMTLELDVTDTTAFAYTCLSYLTE